MLRPTIRPMELRKHKADTRPTGEEVIEVEVERLGVRPSRWDGIKERLISVFKPVLLGGLVDLGDMVSSPILAAIWMPIGMVVGYVFASFLDAPPTWRLMIAGLVGLYWVVPFTSPVPVAAATAAFVYIFKPGAMDRDPVLDR